MRRREFITLLGGSLCGLVGVRRARTQDPPKASASREYGPWGFDLSGADFASKPGDDFFR
jgi:hypothetical protein